ncbi:unnamed protein product [Trypanosoma congolense IL3000]|uniref:WGS project CAEQ00000000 data, annotated contig 1264 n=1 Tax=Trypanosoma congolense (strain IL3000) TaxID=1068625 RepID=F9W519_TRYCI|nr:unnamed protein product [Trypanosoma congolense IL3000]
MTRGVRLLMNEGVEAKIFLYQALDLGNDRARFNEHGILTKHECGWHPSGRSPYGSHIQPGRAVSWTASWALYCARVFHGGETRKRCACWEFKEMAQVGTAGLSIRTCFGKYRRRTGQLHTNKHYRKHFRTLGKLTKFCGRDKGSSSTKEWQRLLFRGKPSYERTL